MAEEVQYGTDSLTNKRKYEDQTTPPRRSTGFSAAIPSQSPPDSGNAPPPASYNSVPPPVGDFELAKQRAQEIAARIFSNAEAKRPRVENGVSGFDSTDNVVQKPMISNMPPSSIPVLYGYQGQGASKKIEIPNGRVGVIIGKAGETIKYLQLQSGAKIQVTRDMEADLNSPNRPVELTGTPEQIAKAEQLIQEVLSEAEAGGSVGNRRVPGQLSGEQYVTKIPNNKVGLVIGKGGETIKNMQATSGARIQVIPLHLPPGDPSTERTLQIDGTNEQIEAAKQLVNEVISQNRPRNPGMGGGYSQQGYQTRPPMQQTGYGYVQPGAYPGPTPQYNVPQQQYPGYPPQPASGGYATGWDPTTGAPNQQTSQGGGYDYYGQQQQASSGPTASVDNASYGYSQPPASGYNTQGQGYPQEGYGGYQAPAPQPGYGQPAQGYDQQQAYTTTAPVQGDTSQAPQGYTTTAQQPSPNAASYPPQGSTQPGYGVPASQPGYGTQPPSGYGPNYGLPQAQKPPGSQPAYGQQPQQSPTAQGGYVQPGYPQSQGPPAQAGYAQPDSGAQRAPPSSYGAAGYGAPPYGAPPVAQPGYGQQQPYNSSYAGGYSQPPAYSADAAPASQAVQPAGVTKASPQS
ncbi:hypothetical protein RHGRI_031409 [Rhododendron griersonianum]|uniref:K Homology domain-containing protein n=1 Tax=Rhododendron griersonianum TaxID=479676 RepID=A0AAV6IBJ5_9ERIC|nr:hypothetical protein RHGRI_031409 [Rhododendron griersonianum]